MKSRTAQFGVRENPAPLLRQHGSRLAVKPVSSYPKDEQPESPSLAVPPNRATLCGPVPIDQNPEPFLDCTAAAVVLGGLHPKTVERWAREGRIPAYRYFRRWRFRASELEQWMRSHVKSGCHPCRLDQEELHGA